MNRVDLDFVKRCMSEEFQKDVARLREKWSVDFREYIKNNPEKYSQHQKKYEHSEKGRKARKKTYRNRSIRMQKAQEGLSWNDKKIIRNFYENCPEGYEVDHIIPLSKGGLHRLSNLQYLTRRENQLKASRLYWDVRGK